VRAGGAALTGGAVTGLALALRPGDRALVLDVFVLALGALVLLVLVEATRTARRPDPRSRFDQAFEPRADLHERLPELARGEREVALGTARAYDLYRRLRPTLREVAAHRLATRRGIDLDRSPEEARAVLGEEAWEVVRPDRRPPEDRFAPGLPIAALGRIVDRLEAV
jgi:hypothetical protein